MKIAVTGKGGVGKTTIASNMIKWLAQQGIVYAVDADADSSLGLALGIEEDELSAIKPVVEMGSDLAGQIGNGAFYVLNPDVTEALHSFVVNMGNIRFMRMGGIKTGGSECYCRENTFLRAMVDAMILKPDDHVVLDMGAGIEHLTRGTSGGVDLMLIIVEPGRAAVQTARTIEKLARQLGISSIQFIANKIMNQQQEDFIHAHFSQEELTGIFHYSTEVESQSIGVQPQPIGDSPFLAGEMNMLFEQLLLKWEGSHVNAGNS